MAVERAGDKGFLDKYTAMTVKVRDYIKKDILRKHATGATDDIDPPATPFDIITAPENPPTPTPDAPAVGISEEAAGGGRVGPEPYRGSLGIRPNTNTNLSRIIGGNVYGPLGLINRKTPSGKI